MPDIFISYSSKDREQAAQLTELLASAGLSVWIDQSGIEAATSWSKEIVQAIDGCKAFVVLLSTSSNASTNVHKEVSLAVEKKKKILPLDLEPVSLSEDLQYHLAGLQRTSMTNIDSIIRALGKMGLEATGAPVAPKIVKESDGRKSLMILPFEDLSPTGDNGWFADGIVSELITVLSNVKALRIADNQSTKEFKSYRGQLTQYAHAMGIRYFVQGDIRKFGDNIKITARLLDIDTGDYLWQESIKGTMQDVFEIQEQVAEKVVAGLQLHLSADEKKKLAERGTENSEAYELYLKAYEYYVRMSKEGCQHAVQLATEAIDLDPNFARAYECKALALANLYRGYIKDPKYLEEGLKLTQEALRIKPDLWRVYLARSIFYTLQGKLDEAEEAAKTYVRNAPEDSVSHFSLGFFYGNTNQPLKSIAPYEASLKLKKDDLAALMNLVFAYDSVNDSEKTKFWAEVAVYYLERYLKLHPDEEMKRVSYAIMLNFIGRREDALNVSRELSNIRDGAALYNVACLQCNLEDYPAALKTLQRSIEVGFRPGGHFREFFTTEQWKDGLHGLKDTEDYKVVIQSIEKIEATQQVMRADA